MNQHDPTTAVTLRPGDVIDPYTIERQIGVGGASVVFQARDKLLERDVAIKQILPPPGADPEALRERFRVEARGHKQIAAADSRHLLQPIDALEHPRGCLLITQYIDGVSLESILANETRPMAIQQAVGILAAVATGLKAIHEGGFLHRDLKPANILLPRGGGLKLADFGLAAGLGEQAEMDAATVRYTAPELLRGGEDAQRADGRADLYALGMIAYEMIAGRAKFDEAFRAVVRDQRNPAMRWIKWHTNPRTTAPPLSELAPGTPQPISDLVQRLMEKEPSKRVPDAASLLKAIHRYRQGEAAENGGAGGAGGPAAAGAGAAGGGGEAPVAQSGGAAAGSAPPPASPPASGPGDTAPLPGGRRRLPLLVGIVIAVVVLVIVGLVVFGGGGNQAARATARQRFHQARQASDQGDYQKARKIYAQLAQDWRAGTHMGDVARADLTRTQGHIALKQGDYDQAVAAFQAYDKTGFGDHDTTAHLIDEARRRRQFGKAMTDIRTLIEKHNFSDARQKVRNWRDTVLTKPEQKQLQAVSEKLQGQQARARTDQVLAQVNALAKQDKLDQAITKLKNATASSPDHRLTDRLQELRDRQSRNKALDAADRAQKAGDLDAVIASLKKAQAIRSDPALADRLASLQSKRALQRGLTLLKQRDVRGAQAALTRSINFKDNQAAREALSRIKSVSQKVAFIKAGDKAMSIGDYDSAVSAYTNALKIGPDSHAQAQLTQARTQRALKRGMAAVNQHDTDQAKKYLTTAKQLAPDKPAVQAAMADLAKLEKYQTLLDAGDAARRRSDFGEAKLNYRKAKKILDTTEVRKRINDTEYDQLLAQARGYIDAKQYRSARAVLITAARQNNTQEVQDLLAQVNKTLQGKAEQGS